MMPEVRFLGELSLHSFESGMKYHPGLFWTGFVRLTLIRDLQQKGNDKY